MLDARRTSAFCPALMGGLAVDLSPAFFTSLPPGIRAFTGNSFVLGTLSAVALNLLSRLGVRRTQTLRIVPGNHESMEIEVFMGSQGAARGARRDVIDRGGFNLGQSIGPIVERCKPAGPVKIAARFDEFSLDLRVSYIGARLELPHQRPTNQEIMASKEGEH